MDDVYAKLAMRRGGKRQNQVSIIVHQEEVGVRGPFILSSPGPHNDIQKYNVQPNPEDVKLAASSEDSLELHKSHIRLLVEKIQQPSSPYELRV